MIKSLREFLNETDFDTLTDTLEEITTGENITAEHTDDFHKLPVIVELRGRVYLANEQYIENKDSDPDLAAAMLRTRDAGIVLYATLLTVWKATEEVGATVESTTKTIN